jgi:protein-S-isoprenylcysteine O-methyltransferase Ste14
MKIEDDSARVRFPPPLVYVGMLLLGMAADRLFGSPSLPLLPSWRLGIGVLFGATGIAIMLAGTSQFGKLGNNVEPWKPATLVVATGIYGYTRNPMYLGMGLAYSGLAVALNSVAALALVPVLYLIIRTQVIAREERYLEGKFGHEYLDYKGRVRRWI